MCVDAILRDKLYEKALSPTTGAQTFALKWRSRLTCWPNVCEDHPDDEKVAELAILTLAHSVTAIAECNEKPANPAVLKQISMTDVYKSVLEAIKRPHFRASAITVNHTLELVALSCMHSAPAMKAYPPSIGTCFGALNRLYRPGAEDDQTIFDPRNLATALERALPQHLSKILMNYGAERSEIFLTMHCTRDFSNAMFDYLENENLYKLGLTQAKLSLKTEFAAVDEYFQSADPQTGDWSIRDTGLPFTRWADSLPHCARAIRGAGKLDERDYADILDIKHHVMSRRLEDAFRVAKRGIERNPEQAYFYYALSLSVDDVQGLRASKKGMKCKLITPFLSFQMVQRSVDHAGDMGIKVLQGLSDSGAGDKNSTRTGKVSLSW
ncbi:hypothetical protein D9619_010775 [Psilocybe cf. subviscida]|uniref:Uncharacterized protein n=1 Tax=Psilocybe cf. subviscida TaxID=2480587 RepID=A0A8H5BA06_9AGAR|nr:hypothetical protein D9619_010775 [Psilocybe cf. subviscida]